MAETLRELVVALSLDSSNFSRNMRTINQQIKEAESTFRQWEFHPLRQDCWDLWNTCLLFIGGLKVKKGNYYWFASNASGAPDTNLLVGDASPSPSFTHICDMRLRVSAKHFHRPLRSFHDWIFFRFCSARFVGCPSVSKYRRTFSRAVKSSRISARAFL